MSDPKASVPTVQSGPSEEMLARVRAIQAQRPAPQFSERQIAIVVAAFNGTR